MFLNKIIDIIKGNSRHSTKCGKVYYGMDAINKLMKNNKKTNERFKNIDGVLMSDFSMANDRCKIDINHVDDTTVSYTSENIYIEIPNNSIEYIQEFKGYRLKAILKRYDGKTYKIISTDADIITFARSKIIIKLNNLKLKRIGDLN
ncbi:MAG: hypothetical protein RR359_03590 [Bacilli bacterium]